MQTSYASRLSPTLLPNIDTISEVCLKEKNEEMYFCNTNNKRESKYLGHLLIEYRHSCYYLQKPCPKHLNLLFMQIYDPLKYLHSYINNNRGIEGKHEYIKICYFSKYRSGSKISPINDMPIELICFICT